MAGKDGAEPRRGGTGCLPALSYVLNVVLVLVVGGVLYQAAEHEDRLKSERAAWSSAARNNEEALRLEARQAKEQSALDVERMRIQVDGEKLRWAIEREKLAHDVELAKREGALAAIDKYTEGFTAGAAGPDAVPGSVPTPLLGLKALLDDLRASLQKETERADGLVHERDTLSQEVQTLASEVRLAQEATRRVEDEVGAQRRGRLAAEWQVTIGEAVERICLSQKEKFEAACVSAVRGALGGQEGRFVTCATGGGAAPLLLEGARNAMPSNAVEVYARREDLWWMTFCDPTLPEPGSR